MNIALQHEIKKCQHLLLIPVTNLEFDQVPAEVKIYSTKKLYMGKLPVLIMAGIIQFNTSEEFVNKLDWSSLALMHKDELLVKIKEFDSTTEYFKVSKFRRLISYLKEAPLFGYNCEYQANKWVVHQDGKA